MKADGMWKYSRITGLEGKGRLGNGWCLVPPSPSFHAHPSLPSHLSVPCGKHSWLPTNTGSREHKCLFSSFFSSDWPLLFSSSLSRVPQTLLVLQFGRGCHVEVSGLLLGSHKSARAHLG